MNNTLHSAVVAIIMVVTLLVGTGCATQLKSVTGISRLGYSIQVGAFSEVNNAERLTVKLQAKGIEAFYFRKDNGVYVVRFGDYPARDKARKAAEKLVESYFIASPDAVFSKSAKVETAKPTEKSVPVKRAGSAAGKGCQYGHHRHY